MHQVDDPRPPLARSNSRQTKRINAASSPFTATRCFGNNGHVPFVFCIDVVKLDSDAANSIQFFVRNVTPCILKNVTWTTIDKIVHKFFLVYLKHRVRCNQSLRRILHNSIQIITHVQLLKTMDLESFGYELVSYMLWTSANSQRSE